MVARHVQRYVVSCRSELEHVEQNLAGAREPVVIEANSDSTVLSEIDDFRNLAASGRVSGVPVAFASDDPLRRELARIVGLTVEDPLATVSGIRRAIESNAPTRQLKKFGPERPATSPLGPALSLTEALDHYTAHGGDDSYASFSFVVNPPVPRRPDQNGGGWYHAGAAQSSHPGSRDRRASRKLGRAAGVATVAVVALLVASAAILLALLAPHSSVTLIPTTSVISADVTYGVAGQPGSFDVTIEPSLLTGEITYSESIQTTGIRSVADGTALGAILLTNPYTTETYLPAGTVMTTADGIAFTTVEDVVVPPADPYGTATMGSAVASIRAVEAGPESNIPAQELSGQMENGLYYSNREQTNGGTMRDIAVVSEFDIEALRANAQQSLDSQAASSISALVPEGQQMVEGSGQSGDVAMSFSMEPGMDATEVSVDAVMSLSAQAYDTAELQRLASEELNRRLTAAVPNDNVLLASRLPGLSRSKRPVLQATWSIR